MVHVLVGGNDAGDGGDWDTAKSTIAGGMAVAAERVAAGVAETCDVWVGGGTYVPIAPEGRGATLQLAPAVYLYGGFSGHETTREQRDLVSFETILSGDVLGDDIPDDPSLNRGDNLYHVVRGANSAVLDGFTIRGGHADDDPGQGGGMVNDAVAPFLRNVTFRDNWARLSGGAMANLGGASPTVQDSLFSRNTAGRHGAGAHNSGGSPSFVGCTFAENVAAFGAGMSNWDSSSTIVDSTFRDNLASPDFFGHDPSASASYGSGIYNHGGAPTVTGSSFLANHATDFGGGIFNYESPARTEHCTFNGNSAGQNGGAVVNLDSPASILGSTFFANTATTGGAIYSEASAPEIVGNEFDQNHADRGGAIHNAQSSGVVIGCTFRGNEATTQGAGIENWAASPLVQGCLFSDNVAVYGGGIANFSSSAPVVTRCQFLRNVSQQGGAMLNDAGSLPHVISSYFEANTAVESEEAIGSSGYGGAIVNSGAAVELDNCFLGGNGAMAAGGGVYSEGGSTLLVKNCTLVENMLTNADGVGRAFHTVGSTLTVINSIVWNDPDSRPLVSNGEQGSSKITYSTISGGCSSSCTSDPTGNLDADPQFVDPGSRDFRLRPGSPCIDSGKNDAVPWDAYDVDGDGNRDEPTPDANGSNRVVGVAVDQGAYEYSP